MKLPRVFGGRAVRLVLLACATLWLNHGQAGAQTAADTTKKPTSTEKITQTARPGHQAFRPAVVAPAAAPVVPRTGEDLDIGKLHVTVWRPTGTAAAPLIIFSHAFHGSSHQSSQLMKSLSEHGYLVIAPNHRDAYRFGVPNAALTTPAASFATVRRWTDATYRDRYDDIAILLSSLKADANWKKSIDWDRIGLMGHSLGGYTVLGAAGAWRSWKINEVKAVIALSPFCTPFIQGKTLGGISVPVMYQGGSLDIGITPSIRMKGGAFEQTPAPDWYVELPRAGHFAWTDLNATFQTDISQTCLAFLDKYLKGDEKADIMGKSAHVLLIKSRMKTAKPATK